MGRRRDDDPRYLQIASDLRAGIAGGTYSAGGQLPTEAELCARYAVSRFTVREALRRLQAEGLIERRRGSGTTVATATNRAVRQSLSNVEEILQYAAHSHFAFEHHGLVRLSRTQARDLGAEAGARWCRFTGIRTTGEDGRPIALTDAFVHPDLAEAAKQVRPGTEAIFTQLERLGHVRVARIDQDIEAVAANAQQADALQVPRRSPCLRIVRAYHDETGRLFELSSSIHPGDRFTYSMHIDAPL